MRVLKFAQASANHQVAVNRNDSEKARKRLIRLRVLGSRANCLHLRIARLDG